MSYEIYCYGMVTVGFGFLLTDETKYTLAGAYNEINWFSS